jgi:hypothetical protein
MPDAEMPILFSAEKGTGKEQVIHWLLQVAESGS